MLFMYTDVPSPPRNLRQSTPDNTSHATIEWDAPVFTGGDGISTLMYAITIPGVNYFVEESCTGSNCSHTITADGIFNTSYDVEVTAVNTCGEKSSPESITVRRETNGDFSITIINPCVHAQRRVIVVGLCTVSR